MYYVYILLSGSDNKLYIGYSADLRNRLLEHQLGRVEATKYRRPWQLVYYESYENQKQATEREQKLKQFGSAYHGLIKRLNLKIEGA